METPKRTYKKHKTETKVTVKHFLNTELKPFMDRRTGVPCYPLYVRVSVNRQLTQFKSRLAYTIPVDQLSLLLNEFPVKLYADNEKVIIEKTIREMKPEEKANFKLTNWSSEYKPGLDSLSGTIYRLLEYNIEKILKNSYRWEESEIKGLRKMTFPEIFSHLAKMNIPEAKEIKDTYGVLLETESYERRIQAIQNVSYDFCLWDGKYGFFQTQLLESGIQIEPNYIQTLNQVIPLIEI